MNLELIELVFDLLELKLIVIGTRNWGESSGFLSADNVSGCLDEFGLDLRFESEIGCFHDVVLNGRSVD